MALPNNSNPNYLHPIAPTLCPILASLPSGAGESISDRGFVHWAPITPRTGGGEVRFYESSSAVAIRGTLDDPEMIPGPFAWLAVGGAPAHLTYEEVEQLVANGLRWLHMHIDEKGNDRA